VARSAKRRRTPNGAAWFRKFDSCWYATIEGKRQKLRALDGTPIRGQEKKREAEKAAARLKLGMQPNPSNQFVTVGEVLSFYIGKIRKTESPKYVDQVQRWLDRLNAYCGAMDATKIKKSHIEDWIAGYNKKHKDDKHRGWTSPNSRRTIITIVLAAFNSCVKEEDFPLDSNPLRGIEKPAAQGRVTFFEDEDIGELLDLWNQTPGWRRVSFSPVADFFNFLLHTGARPSEVARLTAAHAEETPDGLQFVLRPNEHKVGKRTGEEKIIFCFPVAEEIARRLMAKYPEGPIFRSPRNEAPWTVTNWVNHFVNARNKLGWEDHPRRKELSLYSAKHTFAKRCLLGYYGIRFSLYEVAQLLGITHDVAERHYAKRCKVTNTGLWQNIRQAGNAG